MIEKGIGIEWLLTEFGTECTAGDKKQDAECEEGEEGHFEPHPVFLSFSFLGAGCGIEDFVKDFGEDDSEARGVVVWREVVERAICGVSWDRKWGHLANVARVLRSCSR